MGVFLAVRNIEKRYYNFYGSFELQGFLNNFNEFYFYKDPIAHISNGNPNSIFIRSSLREQQCKTIRVCLK